MHHEKYHHGTCSCLGFLASMIIVTQGLVYPVTMSFLHSFEQTYWWSPTCTSCTTGVCNIWEVISLYKRGTQILWWWKIFPLMKINPSILWGQGWFPDIPLWISPIAGWRRSLPCLYPQKLVWRPGNWVVVALSPAIGSWHGEWKRYISG